ncbi:MAG: endoribonuclease MazF [Gemmataceae bacterium]|nr:endoribonuclease MazF [Gemmataceae bacterium]MCI0742840.1 endoribonuclease MazF [Gemmataceae bacterium]
MVSRAAKSYVPDRGDVVWLDFDPQAGHEQAGRRPALVLSPRFYNSPSGLAVLCPITSKAKGYPYEVAVPTGLGVSGVVLSDQVKNLDWKQRRVGFLCEMPSEIVDEVLEKLLTLIDPATDDLGAS